MIGRRDPGKEGATAPTGAPPPGTNGTSHTTQAAETSNTTRAAAYLVVRWCVGNAMSQEAVRRDPELRRINLLLRKLAKTGESLPK